MYVHCTRMAGDVDKAKGKLHLTQSKVRSVLRALLLTVEFHELFKMWQKRSLFFGKIKINEKAKEEMGMFAIVTAVVITASIALVVAAEVSAEAGL